MATYAIIARHDEAGLVQWLTVTDRSNRVGYEKSRQALGDLQAKATRVAFDAMHDTFFNHLSDLRFVVIEDDPRADPFADFQSLQDDDWEACYDDFAADQYETRSTFNWHSRWISQQQRDWLKQHDAQEREVERVAYAEWLNQYAYETLGNRHCRFADASYCVAHDYDHVLARQEQDDFNGSWARMKNEAAAQERRQEAAIYLNNPV